MIALITGRPATLHRCRLGRERPNIKNMVNDSRNEIRTAKDKHAIEAAAFGIEWTTQLQQAQMEAVSTIFETNPELASLLPNKKSLPSINLKVENEAPNGFSVQSTSAADFTGPDGAEDGTLTLSWRPEFVSCATTNYLRWKTSKPRMLQALMPFVDCALRNEGVGIAAIGIQYIDAFRWSKTSGNMLSKVLRDDGDWIPKRFFSSSSLWHVHQGWFSASRDGRRVLNNLNIDLMEEPEDFLLRIQGQHRIEAVSFNDETSEMKLTPEHIDEGLEHLHLLNKKVLSHILTPETLSMIGLKVEGA